MIKQISVIGQSGIIDEDLQKAAFRIGEAIAENNKILICGGRDGVMEQACRGVRSADGTAVGILMSYDKADANEYVDIVLPTGLNQARNTCVVSSGDLVIAIGGYYGTLSEIALAKSMGKRVIGYKTWSGKGYISELEIENKSVDEICRIIAEC